MTAGEPPLRDVVFDLGGVLVDWDPRHLLCGDLGFDREAADHFLDRVCTREWHAGIDGGRSFEAAGAELVRSHPEHEPTIRAYARDWEKMFAGAFPASVRFLTALKRAGFRLHALSNYPGERIEFLYRRFDFMREFDTVVLSGLIGIQKPAAEIFEYLFATIGTRRCLFLDDRLENVEAARVCGIQAVRYRPPPADADPRRVAAALGLPDLLEDRLPNRNLSV